MKIAKRALVVIMALAIVCCMSAMAFAAGSVSLSYDGDKNISITANGMIGLKSFDFVITADDGIVIKNLKKSSDAAACEAGDNAFTTDFNKGNGKFSGYFKENLWDLDTWKAAADDIGEEIPSSFNPSSFNMGTLVIDASGATGPAYVYVKGTAKGASDVTVDEKVLVKEGAAPVTEAPATEAPATEAPATEAPATNNANPNTGDVPTGDNMALAAAASVVALAGAAFVITKKRK